MQPTSPEDQANQRPDIQDHNYFESTPAIPRLNHRQTNRGLDEEGVS
jgi:hypothetical protein